MNKKIATNKKQIASGNAKPSFGFAFERINYILMLVGVGLIIIGYVLLTGGGSDNPDVFNYDLFNFRRLILSPLFIIAGLIVEVFAILKKSKTEK
ncbi:MAG: DUF3098 domain-containing protein [Bacteroidales bacterium]|jgi:hypothetical protein|nr:DUF3098 domain-containing protein [Bacteroidales bacterium]